MSKFTTKYDKICAFCGNPFISQVPRGMFCSRSCKAKYYNMHASKVKDPGTGLYPKTCAECGETFMSRAKNTRICPECNKNHRRESVRSWQKNHPEWQKNWVKNHPDKIKEYKNNWNSKNPDKLKAQYKRKQERKTAKNRKARALERQKILEQTAIDYRPTKRLDRFEFMFSIGIIRMTANRCHCTRCGSDFILCRTESPATRILKHYAEQNKSPCPYCSETPVGHSVANIGSKYEHELRSMYPNLKIRGYRPEWLGGKEIDLYDPDARVGIEFNGLRWHSTRQQVDPNYHRLKADLAEKNGVQLIQIYDTEWVQRRECVIDKLDALFHKNVERIAARKLEVKILHNDKDHSAGNRFLDVNHIQGGTNYQWGVALMRDGEMLAVCTFKYGTGYATGGQNKNTRKYWELNRYATKMHICIQGGLSRCIAAFMRTHEEVNEFYSFADRRWTSSARSAYESSGFIEVGRQLQNYMYTNLDVHEPLKSKQFMRKSRIKERNPEIYSDDKTEDEMSRELGWFKVWDAGKIKYKYTRT